MTSDELLNIAVASLSQKIGSTNNEKKIRTEQFRGGGQSLIYKATSPGEGAFCIKIKRKDKGIIHLMRETDFLTSLNSPYFPQLVVNGAESGFIIESWVEGIYLNLYTRHLLLSNINKIARDLSNVLTLFTSRQLAIMHRDIKPDNLRLCGDHLVVLDFGSAEYEDSRPKVPICTFPKLGSRTHVFEPFEQLTSQPMQNRKVDVFASACLIYAILTGQAPYDNAQSGYHAALSYYKDKENGIYHLLKPNSSRLGMELFGALRVNPDDRVGDLKNLVSALEEENFEKAH